MCGVHDLTPLELVAPTDRHYLEADLAKGITIEDHAPIKHKRGLVHGVVHGFPVDLPELLPFRRDNDRFTVLSSRERCLGNRDLLLDYREESASRRAG
jgi:hypothetical protein